MTNTNKEGAVTVYIKEATQPDVVLVCSLLTLNRFHTSGVSIDDFEHMSNAS